MAEATATELAVSSGLIPGTFQLAKSGRSMITKWFDRARGLALLKKLPKGPLEAFVFGEDDVTPQLLAALSLGGSPGARLSMIALGLFVNLSRRDRFLLRDAKTKRFLQHSLGCPPEEENRPRFCWPMLPSLMDGELHEISWLCEQHTSRLLRVHVSTPPLSDVRLDEDLQEVIGFARNETVVGGLVLRHNSQTYLFCENLRGELKVSGIDVPSDLGSMSSPDMFMVSSRVLEDYSAFETLCNMLEGYSVTFMMAVQKVAKELGEEFAAQSSRDGISLLSRQYLRDVHNDPTRRSPLLRMPTHEELATRIREARVNLPLRDRDVELVLVNDMQKVVSDFVDIIESEAARPGHVGVRSYKRKELNLIRSCITQASGMEPTFAIFEGFRKHNLNIAIAPGCTTSYFPGLGLTVAFPEGFEVRSRKVAMRTACPFTTDLQESFSILLALAPKVAESFSLLEFAKTLSSDLSKDPALALSPVSEAVVRALSPRGRPCSALYLTNVLGYLKKHNPKSTWSEASIAGILCQLGMTLSLPPRSEGLEFHDFRCFFQVCREVWPSTCFGAELVVDCSVDISACAMWFTNEKILLVPVDPPLYTVGYELTQKVGRMRWTGLLDLFARIVGSTELEEMRELVCFLHRTSIVSRDSGSMANENFPVPVRVVGFSISNPPPLDGASSSERDQG